MRNVYDAADDAIRQMNKRNLKAFDRLRLMKHDELNIIREVMDVYRLSEKYARQLYYEIAVEAYIIALIESGMPNDKATRLVDEEIDRDWVDMWLEETDPLTKYLFGNEAERKGQRLAEALSVSLNWNDEIDQALRQWTKQVGQFALNATDRARMEAFKKAGVRKVRWVTEQDGKVCGKCQDLEGRVFPIDKAPGKAHVNCRCWYVPADNAKKEKQ